MVPPQGAAAPRRFFARRAHAVFLGAKPRQRQAPRRRTRPPAARTGKSLPPQFRAFARELRLFSASLLLFAADCGNIIRQYCFAAEYALVAQPVEHLTFNQRARDSSSLERTKIPRRIVRFLVGFSVFWSFAHFLHTGGKAVFFLALSAFCASWRNLSGLAQTSSVEFVTESVKVYKVRQDGFANFIAGMQ